MVTEYVPVYSKHELAPSTESKAKDQRGFLQPPALSGPQAHGQVSR